MLLHSSCDRVSEKVTRDKGRRIVTPSTSLAVVFFLATLKKKRSELRRVHLGRPDNFEHVWDVRDLYISLIRGDGRAR